MKVVNGKAGQREMMENNSHTENGHELGTRATNTTDQDMIEYDQEQMIDIKATRRRQLFVELRQHRPQGG
ncbi:unnamed protein product [Oppiella nova]|uniref:Uncharacterized protein n=1 Tax=Oppiella nova TaxID=334625 RepID=A0A7R9QN01_9ACAR|nr:unnamed protein product [Oppiella nova]CAG2168532.1 unnamed protein product [Oppiella nova]